MKRFNFYSNMLPIMMLSVVGTCVSVIITALGIYYGAYLFLPIHTNSTNTISYVTLQWMECIAYGALISSTDPISTLAIFHDLRVDSTLFYIVFGESVLNDAIAITIFKVASSYITVNNTITHTDVGFFISKFIIMFMGSCIIGYASGIMSALIFKHFPSLQTNNLTVICIFISTVYMPFLLAGNMMLIVLNIQ